MPGTHRLRFSKTTMAAVGLACLVPNWHPAGEGARVSLDCAALEIRQLEPDIGDWEVREGDAADGPTTHLARIETIADHCDLRKFHEQDNDALVGGGVPRYDPVRKLWQ